MIDTIWSCSQIAVLIVAIIHGISIWIKDRTNQLYILSIAGLGCALMGDVVYYLYIWVKGYFPATFSATDLSYFGVYLFFISALFLSMERWNEEKRQKRRKYYKFAIMLDIIIIILTIFMIRNMRLNNLPIGSYFIYVFLHCMLCFLGIVCYRTDRGHKTFYLCLLLFLFCQVMMTLFSSFGMDIGYYFFDLCLTVIFPWIVPTAKKGEKQCST